MTADENLRFWQRRFGLRSWRIVRLPVADRPASNSSAMSEWEHSGRVAKLWVDTEAQVIHELLHLRLSALDDAFWRATAADKALRTLWSRRSENTIVWLEKIVLAALREGGRRKEE